MNSYIGARNELNEAMVNAKVLANLPEMPVVIARDEVGADAGRIILDPEINSFTSIEPEGNRTFAVTDDGLVETFMQPTPTREVRRRVGNLIVYDLEFTGERPDPVVTHHGSGEDVIGFIQLAASRVRNARSLDEHHA